VLYSHTFCMNREATKPSESMIRSASQSAMAVLGEHAPPPGGDGTRLPKPHCSAHLDARTVEHPLHPFLRAIVEQWSSLRLRVVRKGPRVDHPMLWRMLSLWEPDVKLCHARDIDSLPTPMRYAASAIRFCSSAR
jgi:hypothetical protein